MGVVTPKGVIDVTREVGAAGQAAVNVPTSVAEVLQSGKEGVAKLSAFIASRASTEPYVDEATLQFAPSVPSAGKIICVGLNYRKHAEETGAAIPTSPILFNKFANALAGHGEPVPIPRTSEKVDYEAELAIVIGKTAKYVSKEEALGFVFGYSTANDLSARDLQNRTSQWMLGKSCDKFAPMGPYLVTADEVPNPNALDIQCVLNGEVRQHSNTSDMIFHCDEIVSYISQHMTLSPGDVILTGTPEGVVLGYPPEKQVYLKPGDEVTIEIEGLGRLTNRMVADAK